MPLIVIEVIASKKGFWTFACRVCQTVIKESLTQSTCEPHRERERGKERQREKEERNWLEQTFKIDIFKYIELHDKLEEYQRICKLQIISMLSYNIHGIYFKIGKVGKMAFHKWAQSIQRQTYTFQRFV